MENCEMRWGKKMCGKEINEGIPLTINGEQIYVCAECFIKWNLKE